jgi:DNA-binding beta-propeller fold protein YncE
MRVLKYVLGAITIASSFFALNSSIPVLSSSLLPKLKQVQVQGTGVSQQELGIWEVEVDTETQKNKIRQVSGNSSIKVASVLGGGAVSSTQTGALFENTTLFDPTNTGVTYATYSARFTVTNQTGTTLGLVAPNQVTGIDLMLVPYKKGTTSVSECPTADTNLAQPICVITNTSQKVPRIGASGITPPFLFSSFPVFTYIYEPVYMAQMSDRSGNSLSIVTNPDDSNPPEKNEATAGVSTRSRGATSISPYFARSIWRPNLTLTNGSSTNFGLRFRYAQDSPGSGQPRVTQFRFRFRIIADRLGGLPPKVSSSFTTTIAGIPEAPEITRADGIGTSARLGGVRGLVQAPGVKTVYIVNGFFIRKVDLSTRQVTTVANINESGLTPGFDFTVNSGIAINRAGTKLYVAAFGAPNVYEVNIATQAVTKIAGTDNSGFQDGNQAQFNSPSGVVLDASERFLFVADRNNHRIRQIDLFNSLVSTLAGNGLTGATDGVGTAASFNFPSGVALSPDGLTIFVADTNNQKIRAINLATKQVSTLAGSGVVGSNDGAAEVSSFNQLSSLAVSPDQETLYIGELGKIRAIDLTTKVVRTVSELKPLQITNSACNPGGIAVAPSDTVTFTCDSIVNRLHLVEGEAP